MKSTHPHRSRGFTLVELLVVITMIVVLVAITVTMVFRFKKSGDGVVAANNIRQIQVANMGYATDNSGRFVPPIETIDGKTYKWFENPGFISQLKGESSTYLAGGGYDLSLDRSLMDPAVARAKSGVSYSLDTSYGYTRPESGDAALQTLLVDPARSAAFITADVPFADDKSKIAYRHADKAVIGYYDGHANLMSAPEVDKKADTDIFWQPVPVTPTPP